MYKPIRLLLALSLCILLVTGFNTTVTAGGKGKGQNKSEQWMPPGLSKKEKAQWTGDRMS